MKLVKTKQSTSYYYKNKLKNNLNLFLFVILILCIIGFIVTSIGTIDLKINEVTEKLMDITFFKVGQLGVEEFGLYFPIWIGFTLIVIFLESFQIRLKNNYFEENRTVKFFKKGFITVVISFYLLGFAIRAYMFYVNFMYKKNLDMGWGVGFDVKSQLPMVYRLTAIGFAYGTEICVSIFLVGLFRFKLSKSVILFRNNLGFQAIKVTIFFTLSYLMIGLFKHFFGRPFYFSVIYDEMYQDMINMGLTPSTDLNAWKGPDLDNLPVFTRWYVPNNILQNFKYGFTTPPHNDPNNDQWGNMDFPSGHTSAVAILVSLISFLGSTDKTYIKKGVFNLCFSLVIIGGVNMMFTMVYSRFHGASDVLFSSIYGILAGKGSSKITEKSVLPILALVRKKVQSQITEGFLIRHDKKDQLILGIYYNHKIIPIKKFKNLEKTQPLLDKKLEKYQINILQTISQKQFKACDEINNENNVSKKGAQ